jgi:hypothetical protein
MTVVLTTGGMRPMHLANAVSDCFHQSGVT